MASPATLEDQARLLEDALVAVRQQTAMMRKCLETPGKLMDALKCWYVAPTPYLSASRRLSSGLVPRLSISVSASGLTCLQLYSRFRAPNL